MRRLTILLLTIGIRSLSLSAQNENQILDDQIYSVQLTLKNHPLSFPIVGLNSALGTLVLRFDHMGDEFMDYKYTLEHCNSDWQPSELNYAEYVDGFSDDRITNISNSFNTLTEYTHYEIALPNRNIRWTKSGNYLLKVYDYYADKLVLVRRFVVTESLWNIDAKFVRTGLSEKKDTWHEIDFAVNLPVNTTILPRNEVGAVILQNGRWDNAIGPLTPYLNLGKTLSFDYHDKIVFPAGKEFRFFDIRMFQYRGEGVKIIDEKPDYYEVTLRTDESRLDRPLNYRVDANGKYLIQNLDRNPGFGVKSSEVSPNLDRSQLEHISSLQDTLNNECDYASVLFSIRQNMPLDDADVYVFGELSDWQLKPEFKMAYSHDAQMYYCETFLKQGYYNYQYVVLDHQSGALDLDGLEGNWFETENLYTILIYYKSFGERYDRIMAVNTLSNVRN
jgi:hypothetical protein